MKAVFYLAGRVRRARRNARPCALFLLVFSASIASSLHAQVGNQNPGGASGIFNGQITTGCSYDPYTGNATRSITDIAVAGAVGEYPLVLVRTANSRAPSTTEVFGWAGGWNHNYNWILEDSPTGTQNFHPTRYTVDFPDGRVETFRAVTWDSNYRVRPGADTPAQTTSAGVRERFVPLNTSTMLASLILPDGGKIEFTASQHVANGRYYYKYHATAIIDPYGLRTQLVDEVVPDGSRRRLVSVIEPAGRYLHFFYVTTNGARIDHVTASDGRTVNYYYIYCNGCRLDHVQYYNNANWTARYNYCNPNVGQGLPPLLWTADDPMYSGPMKRIAYEYKPATPNNPDGTAPVYGQILRERYWDGNPGNELGGAAVSELTIGAAPANHNIRIEKRANDANQTRRLIYDSAGYIAWAYDFMNHAANQTYDGMHWINAVTDRNGNTTNYTCDPVTGNVTQVQFPSTVDVTPSPAPRGTISYSYTNDYYVHTITDEGNHTTTITRDGNNRATQIDYADGGYEAFAYDPGHFYLLQSHRMVTSGIETFTYDSRGLKQSYRNPDNATGNPTARYRYDSFDRVIDVTDVFGTSLGDGDHSTSFTYNGRGQVTVITLPQNPNDNVRHVINSWYNQDGTVSSKQNELYQTTSYTYDAYRRLRSVIPPVRGFNDNNLHATYYFYDANGTGDDYKYTDSNVTVVTLPSGKEIKAIYDDNRRRSTVIVGFGTGDAATTSYGYDNVGNLTSVVSPNQQPGQPFSGQSTTMVYDGRNRPMSITDALSRHTNFTYDTAGRKKSIQRPNNQVITCDTFDSMNRVTQQTVTNSATQNAVTRYNYYTIAHDGPNAPVGLLRTMQDPYLIAINSNDAYIYTYDSMGRKTSITYPAEPGGAHRVESFTYDNAGRLWKFTNRDSPSKTQTFGYDALNRTTGYTWNDGGVTPSVTFVYDAASRLTNINNANAAISRAYFYDNLLRVETENITNGRSKTVTYSYDADGNRASTQYPDTYTFGYTYTGRNQLSGVNSFASYWYDKNGNMIQRNPGNTTTSTYTYDSLDRVTSIAHSLHNNTRTLNYGYYPTSNDRKWVQRLGTSQGNIGDVFNYDYNDQVTAVQLNIANPTTANPGSQTIIYDPNGNRSWFSPPGHNEQYATDNLSQYTSRTIANNTTYAAYDPKGNNTVGVDGSGYTYDAQNRLLTATKSGATMSFKYDGLNRQVSRTAGNTATYSIWDGWNLIEEYQHQGNNWTTTGTYVYGTGGLFAAVVNGNFNYYYQDGSGSTSHLADTSGNLLEWYRYDLQGTPVFYNSSDQSIGGSSRGVRHLFTGQQWYSQIGLYDLRNRFYSPDLGRFLQPDPIGFRGGNNLYRYCGNNPVTTSDPFGLQVGPPTNADPGGPTLEPVNVNWPEAPTFVENPGWPVDLTPLFPGLGGPIPTDGGGPGGSSASKGGTSGHGTSASNNSSTNPQQPPPQTPPQPSIDPFHATTTAEFIAIGNMIEHGDTTDTTPAIDPIDFLSGGIAALARTSVRSVVQKAAVFWAGGRVAEDAARTFAKTNGGTVIADTAAGRALAQSTVNIQARGQWLSLSQDFARNASGEVNVFQNARGVPLDTIWRNEYEILMENPNVTGIKYWVVMPDGSVVPAP